jgi:hypothetical protein
MRSGVRWEWKERGGGGAPHWRPEYDGGDVTYMWVVLTELALYIRNASGRWKELGSVRSSYWREPKRRMGRASRWEYVGKEGEGVLGYRKFFVSSRAIRVLEEGAEFLEL